MRGRLTEVNAGRDGQVVDHLILPLGHAEKLFNNIVLAKNFIDCDFRLECLEFCCKLHDDTQNLYVATVL